MTNNEYRYMLDLKSLDDIRNAMLEPGIDVAAPDATRDRLAARGWVRVLPESTSYGKPVCELTTRGLRAVCREARRRAERLISENTK